MLHEVFERFGRGFSTRYHPVLLVDEFYPFRVGPFLCSFFLSCLHVLDVYVKLVQIDIRQYRADNAALGGTDEAFPLCSV